MNKNHPLAVLSHARIDLFTRGRQANTIRDSFILLKQSVRQLPVGDGVLYINTLTTADVVIDVAEKLSKRYNREISTFSGPSKLIMERLEMIGQMISVKRIKLVILNSFEFAAIYSRQRNRLAVWLREMRDEHGIRIVVYSSHASQSIGAHGVLSGLAERVQDVGAWQYESDDSLTTQESPLLAAQEFSKMLEHETDETSEETFWVDRPMVHDFVDFSKKLMHSALKNNDLSAVATREEEVEVIDEEELEYA